MSGGDYTLEDSVYILFTTRTFTTGAPGTLSAGATCAVYEDVTATPIDTLIAVTEDLNSVTGLNAVTIEATAANNFNAGGHYHVIIDSASTVGGVSVQGEVVGSFTIAASAAAEDLANATDGLGAIKAETALIVEDTNELQTDDIPGTLALIPQSGGTTSWNATALAAINAEADTALTDIHLDHLLAADYDPASKPGTATALLNELIESDAGVSRFTANALEQGPSGGGGSAADGSNYPQNAVYLDTVNGTPGSTVGTHGIVGSPTDTIANAKTLADALVTDTIIVIAGSSVTLAATMSGYVFKGDDWIFSAGGQTIDGTHIYGATINNTWTYAGNPHWHNCHWNANLQTTGPGADYHNCTVEGGTSFIANSISGRHYFYNPTFGVGYISAPSILNFNGATGGASYFNVYDGKGEITISNMTDVGALAWLSGGDGGKITFDSSNTSGGSQVYGEWELSDSSGGGHTVLTHTTADQVWDEDATGHQTGGTFGESLGDPLATGNSIRDLVTTVDTVVDAIKLVTDALPESGALTTIDANIDSILADTGTDGVVLSAAQMNKIADHVLRRSWETAADSSDGDTKAFRSLLGAVAKLVNKIASSGGTLTIYEEDDTTALGTQTLTADAAADPIVTVDTV